MSTREIDTIHDGLIFSVDGKNKVSSTSGNTTVYDMVDHVSGLTSASGIANGEVWAFDGVSDIIDLGNDLNIGNDFTIECWALQNSVTGTWKTMLSKWDGGGQFYIGALGSRINFFVIYDGGYSIIQGNNGSVVVDEWVHWSFISDSTKTGYDIMSIYKDGILLPTTNSGSIPTGVVVQSSVNSYIGAQGPSSGYYYDGQIATAKIYNRALSQEEITQNYDATKYRYL